VLSFVRWDTTASILASDANSMLSNAALAASGAHLASAKLGGELLKWTISLRRSLKDRERFALQF